MQTTSVLIAKKVFKVCAHGKTCTLIKQIVNKLTKMPQSALVHCRHTSEIVFDKLAQKVYTLVQKVYLCAL